MTKLINKIGGNKHISQAEEFQRNHYLLKEILHPKEWKHSCGLCVVWAAQRSVLPKSVHYENRGKSLQRRNLTNTTLVRWSRSASAVINRMMKTAFYLFIFFSKFHIPSLIKKNNSGKFQQRHILQSDQIRSDQSFNRVRLFATPWIAARQASLSITNSWSSLRLTSIESVMPSSHLILCRPLLLLLPIPPSIRVFSNSSHEVANLLEFQL